MTNNTPNAVQNDDQYIEQLLANWRRAKIVFAQGLLIGGLIGFFAGVML